MIPIHLYIYNVQLGVYLYIPFIFTSKNLVIFGFINHSNFIDKLHLSIKQWNISLKSNVPKITRYTCQPVIVCLYRIPSETLSSEDSALGH